MFRKMTLALATTVAFGAAVLSPISASAGGKPTPIPPYQGPPPGTVHNGHAHFGNAHFGHHGGWGIGLAAGILGGAIVADSCHREEVVDTPHGPRVRWVKICD